MELPTAVYYSQTKRKQCSLLLGKLKFQEDNRLAVLRISNIPTTLLNFWVSKTKADKMPKENDVIVMLCI